MKIVLYLFVPFSLAPCPVGLPRNEGHSLGPTWPIGIEFEAKLPPKLAKKYKKVHDAGAMAV